MRRSFLTAGLYMAGGLMAATACAGSSATTATGDLPSVPVPVSGAASASSSASPPRATVGPGGEDALAQEAAARERAAAAPGGVPVSGKPYDPNEPDFQDPVVTESGVTVYRPKSISGGLTVPVTIRNNGSDRAAYTAEVRITGPGGFDVVMRVSTGGVPIAPGNTWPTEITAADPGKPVPVKPKIVIGQVAREPSVN